MRTSRRQLLDDEDVSETSAVEEDEYEEDEEGSIPGLSGPSGESSEESENVDDDETREDVVDDEEEEQSESEALDDISAFSPARKQQAKPTSTAPAAIDALSTTLRQKREEDVKKGKAIARQLVRSDIAHYSLQEYSMKCHFIELVGLSPRRTYQVTKGRCRNESSASSGCTNHFSN